MFALVSFLLAMAILSIFVGARPLWAGDASPVAYTLVAIVAAFWYVDFTWFREQFCIYLCPYARFQSAMTDDETLLVSYDEGRGEPRDKRRGPEGGCIACQKSVSSSARKASTFATASSWSASSAPAVSTACESVMSHFGQPTLVRYSSLLEDGRRDPAGGTSPHPRVRHVDDRVGCGRPGTDGGPRFPSRHP